MFPIASGYATNIAYGDVVLAVSDGTVAKDTGTATATPLGVFLGVQYTNAQLGYKQQDQLWPASTVAADAIAYVADDPFLVMQAQASGSAAVTNRFNNAALVQNAVDTAAKHSRVAIGSFATTNTLPVRVIGFVEGPGSAVGDAFTDCLIIWNFGMHHYMQATGT
jgi:hypothetical protein